MGDVNTVRRVYKGRVVCVYWSGRKSAAGGGFAGSFSTVDFSLFPRQPVVVRVKRLVGNLCDKLYTVFLSLSLFHTPSPTHLPIFLTLSFSRTGEIESVGLVYT